MIVAPAADNAIEEADRVGRGDVASFVFSALVRETGMAVSAANAVAWQTVSAWS
jgi:hypothetical protein